MFYSQLNAQEILEIIKPLKIIYDVTVDHNPYGLGGKQTLTTHTDEEKRLNTFNGRQGCINGVDFEYHNSWTNGTYKGKFDLETTPWQNIKPDMCAVGDTVRVLENARECGGYEGWNEIKKDMIGKTFIIHDVIDDNSGIYYQSENIEDGLRWFFPAYCIQKIANPTPKTITINGKEFVSTPELEAMLLTLEVK